MKWPKRHHIGGATTRAHGAKDLTIIDMTEERMIKDLHEAANKKDKYFDDLRQAIKEERYPSGLPRQHIAGSTTSSWEPAAEWMKKQHRRKVTEWEDKYRSDKHSPSGYGTKALEREFRLRQMADALVSNLDRMPKDQLMRMASEYATNLELEALQRALGDPGGYELDPSIMNPRPEGFKHLPFRGNLRWR